MRTLTKYWPQIIALMVLVAMAQQLWSFYEERASLVTQAEYQGERKTHEAHHEGHEKLHETQLGHIDEKLKEHGEQLKEIRKDLKEIGRGR